MMNEELQPSIELPRIVEIPQDTLARRRVTKLQLKDRFGAKWKTLKQAAKTDADLEDMLDSITLSTPDPDGTSVWLDDPRFIAGLGMLVAKNKLTQAEADAIRA